MPGARGASDLPPPRTGRPDPPPPTSRRPDPRARRADLGEESGEGREAVVGARGKEAEASGRRARAGRWRRPSTGRQARTGRSPEAIDTRPHVCPSMAVARARGRRIWRQRQRQRSSGTTFSVAGSSECKGRGGMDTDPLCGKHRERSAEDLMDL